MSPRLTFPFDVSGPEDAELNKHVQFMKNMLDNSITDAFCRGLCIFMKQYLPKWVSVQRYVILASFESPSVRQPPISFKVKHHNAYTTSDRVSAALSDICCYKL